MKKLRKNEELEYILTASQSEKMAYAAEFGVCGPNLVVLFDKYREIFDEVAPVCKRIPDEIVAEMLEDEKYLAMLMTRCLSEENQVRFVEIWPEKVNEYLQTLEANLGDGRGAFLCREAEQLYDEIQEEDPSLPDLRVRLSSPVSKEKNIASPFAALVGLF